MCEWAESVRKINPVTTESCSALMGRYISFDQFQFFKSSVSWDDIRSRRRGKIACKVMPCQVFLFVSWENDFLDKNLFFCMSAWLDGWGCMDFCVIFKHFHFNLENCSLKVKNFSYCHENSPKEFVSQLLFHTKIESLWP